LKEGTKEFVNFWGKGNLKGKDTIKEGLYMTKGRKASTRGLRGKGRKRKRRSGKNLPIWFLRGGRDGNTKGPAGPNF